MRNLLLFLFLTIPFEPVNAIEVNDTAISCPAILEVEKSPLDIKKYQGKVIYLDFWATWCPPCKKSMPFLNSLRNEFVEKGFEIVAINVDEVSDDARIFLQQHPVDYAIAMDPSGQCPEKYGVMAMPSAYFIDRQGQIRFIHLGFRERDEKEIRHRVLELLAEKGK